MSKNLTFQLPSNDHRVERLTMDQVVHASTASTLLPQRGRHPAGRDPASRHRAWLSFCVI